MNYLFSIVLLLSTLVAQNQNLPDEFYQIPETVRAKATLIVSGTYGKGRGPCILRPDGTRAWMLESWFQVKEVYLGKVGGKSIYINSASLPKTQEVSEKLEVGRSYLVLLRPSEESVKAIAAGGHVTVWDALSDEEIIAIVELK